jgi:hypothetical protein
MSTLIGSGVMSVLPPGGIFLGTVLRRTLPGRHLYEHPKDAVRLGVGLIATIAALIPLMSSAFSARHCETPSERYEAPIHVAFGYCMRAFDVDQRTVDQP